MTTLIYLSDPHKVESSATVTTLSVLDDKYYVTTDKTIFHVKGGGQPADSGTINGVEVEDVKIDRATGKPFHVISMSQQLVVGQEIQMKIDPARRRVLSRWHSAGHLLAGIVERLRPDLMAVGAHQYPGEGRVEFEIARGFDASVVDLAQINVEIERNITQSIDVGIHRHPDGTRYIWIDGFKPVGCGGTHVASTDEIGSFIVSKGSISNGKYRLSYRLID